MSSNQIASDKGADFTLDPAGVYFRLYDNVVLNVYEAANQLPLNTHTHPRKHLANSVYSSNNAIGRVICRPYIFSNARPKKDVRHQMYFPGLSLFYTGLPALRPAPGEQATHEFIFEDNSFTMSTSLAAKNQFALIYRLEILADCALAVEQGVNFVELPFYDVWIMAMIPELRATTKLGKYTFRTVMRPGFEPMLRTRFPIWKGIDCSAVVPAGCYHPQVLALLIVLDHGAVGTTTFSDEFAVVPWACEVDAQSQGTPGFTMTLMPAGVPVVRSFNFERLPAFRNHVNMNYNYYGQGFFMISPSAGLDPNGRSALIRPILQNPVMPEVGIAYRDPEYPLSNGNFLPLRNIPAWMRNPLPERVRLMLREIAQDSKVILTST